MEDLDTQLMPVDTTEIKLSPFQGGGSKRARWWEIIAAHAVYVERNFFSF